MASFSKVSQTWPNDQSKPCTHADYSRGALVMGGRITSRGVAAMPGSSTRTLSLAAGPAGDRKSRIVQGTVRLSLRQTLIRVIW